MVVEMGRESSRDNKKNMFYDKVKIPILIKYIGAQMEYGQTDISF